MAKILGKWWVGLRLTCRGCGERFELEASDVPQSGFLVKGPYSVQVACPTCGGAVNVDKPWGAEVPTR